MLSVFASLVLSGVWPNMGIHDGDNKVVWTVGCCDGDLITVDFRDEVGDGNGGNGLLKIYNKTSGLTSSYYLGPFYGTWKAFGPYCAPQCPSENPNCHNLTFTSDANAHETTVTVTDSFGLIKGMGGMEDFPIAFSTIAPAKFCMAGQSEFDMARAQPPSQPRRPRQATRTRGLTGRGDGRIRGRCDTPLKQQSMAWSSAPKLSREQHIPIVTDGAGASVVGRRREGAGDVARTHFRR